MISGRFTSFLYAQPSFLEGVGRILDLGNNLQMYNYSESGQEADARALRADWRAVGDDLRRAVLAAKAQLEEEKPDLVAR